MAIPTPKKPKCNLYLPASRYKKKVIRSLHFDGDKLTIEFQGDNFQFGRIIFTQIIGFRLLNERDLCEFWNEYSEPNGWLYEVQSGGWLDLEKSRPLFNSHEFFKDLIEYLVVDDSCINVLTTKPPEIFDLGSNPT